jgi:hypothetical protein
MKRPYWIAIAVVAAAGIFYAGLRVRDVLSLGPVPSDEEIHALTAERTRLRDTFRELLAENNVLDFANAPEGNILVGVPTAFAQGLVGEMVSGLFSEVRLRLTDIHAHHEDDVKAKMLFTQTVGHFILDVDIHEIRALLKPSEPQLKFGGDKIGIRIPVRVAQGRGTGNVRFQWEGKGLAGAVCGDLDVNSDVSSEVKPTTYTVSGEFLLAAEGDTVVAKPRFGDVVLKIVLKPTEKTWATLESMAEDVKEDKNGICGMAIRKLDVRSLVQKIIDKGFDVKLPPKLFKPIAFPAAVEQSVDIRGRTVTLDVRPLGLRVTPVMLWYAVALGAAVEAPSAAASPSPSPSSSTRAPASAAPSPTRSPTPSPTRTPAPSAKPSSSP